MNNVQKSSRAQDLISSETKKNGRVWITPYAAALRDARSLTGRYENGNKRTDKSHGSWLGALGYLIVIDIVGGWFVFSKSEKNGFLNALKNLTSLDEKERYAIYALRCSLAHNFALHNIPEKKREEREKVLLQHNFRVTERGKKLVELAKIPWDGKSKKSDNTTTIDLEKLGDLVERIHKKLTKLGKEDKLELSHKGEEASKERITYLRR